MLAFISLVDDPEFEDFIHNYFSDTWNGDFPNMANHIIEDFEVNIPGDNTKYYSYIKILEAMHRKW